MPYTGTVCEAGVVAREHVVAALATLVARLDGPDPRVTLRAALALLRYAEPASAGPAHGLSDTEFAQAMAVLEPRLAPDGPAAPKPPNQAATACPARQAETPPPGPPEPARAPTPCPAATPPPPATALQPAPNPSANPMSRENGPSPRAVPPGAESLRRDADPMSRRLLPSSHSPDSAFRRRLPQPPDMEPPWPFQPPDARPYRRQRGPPWR